MANLANEAFVVSTWGPSSLFLSAIVKCLGVPEERFEKGWSKVFMYIMPMYYIALHGLVDIFESALFSRCNCLCEGQ